MIERYAIYCKNGVTGTWMAGDKGFFTRRGAMDYAKIYTDAGFEVEVREYTVSIF